MIYMKKEITKNGSISKDVTYSIKLETLKYLYMETL